MILKILISKKSRNFRFFQLKLNMSFSWKNQKFQLFFEIKNFKIIFLQEKIIFLIRIFFYDLEFIYTFDLEGF